MNNYFIILAVLLPITVFTQSDRYTKGAENGYSWIRMEDLVQFYSTSKETYLSSILERYCITQEKHPEISNLDCKEEIDQLYENGKSRRISIVEIVMKIDEFYSEKQNMVVPIVFAYCYTIKKIAGTSEEGLVEYKNQVLEFCKE